ncbi:hypothetical protein SAMN04489740_0853 [Arthrobacter alpinus]|uniref:Uncharacterized protein n=1 Tax=Arthrobacter alpinus TaxID=656366 RepID=A0A1H5GUF8_9MICC|nr:hypothetical protein [Arthrobacter alpinus]SEE19337.1 hypothetical protein SAMN04489740_0853 [Arthrobacter alpinus]
MPGPYPFDPLLAATPSNPAIVAANASVTIFAPGDATKTPVTIWDLSRSTQLPNPVTTNELGCGPAFLHDTMPQLAWEGGGFSDTFKSFTGLWEDAQAAVGAAQGAAGSAGEAAENAVGAVEEILASVVDDSEAAKLAAQQAAALVGAPTDVSTAALVGNRATLTGGAVYAAVAQGAIIADVSPLKTPLANRLAFVSAFTQGQAQGRDVEIPSTMGADKIPIDGEILINGTGNFRIYTPHSCSIYQTVKPEPIFNVKAPGVIIEPGFVGIGDGLDMTGMVTAINYARYSGVWFNAGSSGSQVRGFKGIGLHRAVRVDPDATTVATPAEVPNISNLKALDIESVDCWVAVSAVGFNDLEVSMRGTYKKAFNSGGVDTTGQPPHLLYVINRGSGSTGRLNYNLHVGPSLAWDSGVPVGAEDAAAAYAIKGVVGLSYDGLQARNCTGILDLINVENVSPGTCVSIDDVYPLDGARASVAIKESTGAHIKATVRAKAGGDYGRQLYVESLSTDCLIEVDLTAAPTTARTAGGTGLVRISGFGNEVRARIRNMGASMRAAIEVQSSSANGNRVIDPKVTGTFQYPVEIRQGSNAVVEYEPSLLASTSSTPVLVASGTTGTVLRDKSSTAGGGGTPAPATGYVDSFNRADSTSLGTTDDGKTYTILNGAAFGTNSNMLSCGNAAVGGAYALPGGGAKDGVITIKVGVVGVGLDGYMLRTDYVPSAGAAFPQDFVRLNYNESTTVKRPRLQTRLAGGTIATLASAATGVEIVAGDTITVTLSGANITVALNGVTIISATDTVHKDRIASGPMVSTPASGHWKLDEIRFVPAA